MQVSKEAVGNVLTEYGEEMKGRTDILMEDGDKIDLEKLAALPETKQVISTLKALGVKNRKHLMDLGFFAGGMLLTDFGEE